jgi:aspartate aminotransferase
MPSIQNKQNRYTPPLGMPELRIALARHLSQRAGSEYSPEEVGVTCGAKQALFNTALILLNPGDEVLIFAPYWETFPTQIQLAGGVPVIIDTSKSGYRPQLGDLQAALTGRTKMIVINTPNNPTGVVYDAALLRNIGTLAKQCGLWVVYDECYGELIREPYEHKNIVSLCPEIKEQTIIVNSFSKSHAVTGWRIGYAGGPKEVITAMHNLQGHTTSNPSTLSQCAAYGVLQDMDVSFLGIVNTFLERQLKMVLDIVADITDVTFAPPEGAFYLYLNVAKKINRKYRGNRVISIDHLAEILLCDARSAVVPGSAFGDPFGLRISYALDEQALVKGLSKIRDILNSIN